MGEYCDNFDGEPVDNGDSFMDSSADTEDSFDGGDMDDNFYEEDTRNDDGENDDQVSDDIIIEDESQISPSELQEQAEMERDAVQEEAEQWADENGLDTWSNGDPRSSYKEDIPLSESSEQDSTSDDKPPLPDDDGIGSNEREWVYETTEQNETPDGNSIDQEVYGHDGLDPRAVYGDTHFDVTDDRYKDEQAEITEQTNLRAAHEIREDDRLQNEELASFDEDKDQSLANDGVEQPQTNEIQEETGIEEDLYQNNDANQESDKNIEDSKEQYWEEDSHNNNDSNERPRPSPAWAFRRGGYSR